MEIIPVFANQFSLYNREYIRDGGSEMSFFDDDFYSTKVRSESRWNVRTAGKGIEWNLQRIWLVVILSLIAGMLLTLWIFGTDRSSYGQVVRIAEQIQPSIVSIVQSIDDPLTDEATGMVLGSGIIFRKDGGKALIMTNHHVVEAMDDIGVVLSNGEYREAAIVAGDLLSDLAVIEIDDAGIKKVAKLGNSDQLKSGETAIAIGNPLGLGYNPTITVGVVSSPKRTIPVSLNRGGEPDWERNVIQTDAAINQGNSGGALVNIKGRVIGINSMKVANMGVEGMGFAIPINEAKPIVESLLRDRKVVRPYMGVASQSLQTFRGTDALNLPMDLKLGVIVLEVTGPALEAGLLTSDVIVQLDDQKVSSTLELRKYLYGQKSVGDKIKVTFFRGNKQQTVTFTLGESQ